MPFIRRINTKKSFAAVMACVLLLACRKDNARSPADTTLMRPDSAIVVAQPAASAAWNAAAGPFLLVQGESANEGIVLLPDSSHDMSDIQPGTELRLLGRGDASYAARLGGGPSSTDAECRVWPLTSVGGAPLGFWSVGFSSNQITALPLDSVELLSSRDSMALAAEASRLASAVTATTAPSFQGLRFTAHDIRRFSPGPGIQAIVAHLIRRVNQEANPQEEQTLLIAERDSGVTSGPYQLAYAERTSGLEEDVTTPEVIGGARIAGHPTLIVARDGDAGVAYAMLERTGLRHWRLRWLSASTRCG